jgi:hypothetical protein
MRGIIFTEVIPKLTPEIEETDLIRLGSIARKNNRTNFYEPLTDALRKIQWVKLMALEAISIEEEIKEAMKPGTLIYYPFGQLKHALAVTDTLIHTKSALDSIAVFLSDFLNLKTRGSERDFKKTEFRAEISSKDSTLGDQVMNFESWFKELQNVRDEWIHRSSVRTMLIIGPSECGPLPIGRNDLDRGLQVFDRPITIQNFFSTSEFVNHHYGNLVRIFCAVIKRCIEIESKSTSIDVDSNVEMSLTVFPTKLTAPMTATHWSVKLGPYGF